MKDENHLKTVALIGRPNVGKSTLFNRLVGKRVAVETPIAGTTRDRLIEEIVWNGEKFSIVDVPGLELGSKKEIDRGTQESVDFAIESADLIVFLVDCTEKDSEQDKIVARRLKKSGKKVILAVNKVDNQERAKSINDFKRLGDFPIFAVSAISGRTSGDLLDGIVQALKKVQTRTMSKNKNYDLKLSIIGRPNVGKSTLLNAIIGAKRAVVSSEPGTTRDIVTVGFAHKGKNILISDTAGIRRPGKLEHDTIESFSVLRSFRALKDCDIAVLVVDGKEGMVALEANLLGEAKQLGKGIILAVNKLDLVEDKEKFMGMEIWRLQDKLNFMPWLPVVFISALEKDNIEALLSQVVKVYENRGTTISQENLNIIKNDIVKSNSQLAGLEILRQKKVNPPIFEAKFKGKKTPHYTQIRYIENKIRDAYPLAGTPIFIDYQF